MKERRSSFADVIQFPSHIAAFPELVEQTRLACTKRCPGYGRRLAYAAHFGITPETATPQQRAYYGI